ncbi:MAG: PQQ-binding-like beta-propeller repeat protein [Chloroflexota bacterium]
MAEVQSVQCPNCGAPAHFEGERGKCEYCGTALERPSPKATQIEIQLPTAQTGPAIRRVSILGCVILVAVIALIGGGVAWAVLAGAGATIATIQGQEDNPSGIPELFQGVVDRRWTIGSQPGRLVGPGDGRPFDLLLSVYYPDEEGYGLVYLDGQSYSERWQSPILGQDSQFTVAPGASFIYVVNEANLIAVRPEDGQVVWQTTLGDVLVAPCLTQCLQVIGDYLVVLTDAGAVEAYNSQTGQPVWSRRLVETPRQLLNVAGHPAALDQTDDGVALHVFNLADGTPLRQMAPRCPNEPFPDDPQTPGIYDPVYEEPAGRSVYFTAGFFEPGCIQRWDTATGEMVWQATFPVDALRYDRPPLVTADALYLTGGDGLVTVISAAGAAVSQWTADADYELTPLAAGENVLVVEARRTRGSERFELWGLDAATGERLWQSILQADEFLEYSTVLHNTDPGIWTFRVAPAGLLVLQVLPNPSRLSLETLRFTDGTAASQLTIPVDEADSFWFNVLAWDEQVVWLELDAELAILDLAGGKLLRP